MDPRWLQQQYRHGPAAGRTPMMYVSPNGQAVQYIGMNYGRPPAPAAMINSSSQGFPQSYSQVARQGELSRNSQSAGQQDKWKKFYETVIKWKVFYHARNENPSAEHAVLFEQYPLPAEQQKLLQAELGKLERNTPKSSDISANYISGQNQEMSKQSLLPHSKCLASDVLNRTSHNTTHIQGSHNSNLNEVNSPAAARVNQVYPDSDNVSVMRASMSARKRRKRAWEKQGVLESKKPVENTEKSLTKLHPEMDDSVLSKRAARFAKLPNAADSLSPCTHDPYAATRQKHDVKAALNRAEKHGYELDLSQFNVTGTCTNLEKKYLRLTGVPDPRSVRPLPVLKASFEMILGKWIHSPENPTGKGLGKHKSSSSQVSYRWVSDQLKAIRQDITVQHIKNNFVVQVYETHARIALQKRDIGEFAQCLTQLSGLYKVCQNQENESEFAGYHILYLLLIRVKYSHHSSDLSSFLANMPSSLRSQKSVRHALSVRGAVEGRLYSNFFRLFDCAPHQGKFLMELMIDYIRYEALRIAFITFRRTLPLHVLESEVLHLDIKLNDHDKELWNDWIVNNKQVIKSSADAIDTKESAAAFSGAFSWPVLDGDNVQRIEIADDI